MSTPELLEQTGFHDASIGEMRMEGGAVRLRFDHIWLGDDRYGAVLDLVGVQQVTRNDQPVDTLRPEGEGSSVIDFERKGDTATLVVDWWPSYTARTKDTCSYTFQFSSFHLRAEPQPEEEEEGGT